MAKDITENSINLSSVIDACGDYILHLINKLRIERANEHEKQQAAGILNFMRQEGFLESGDSTIFTADGQLQYSENAYDALVASAAMFALAKNDPEVAMRIGVQIAVMQGDRDLTDEVDYHIGSHRRIQLTSA